MEAENADLRKDLLEEKKKSLQSTEKLKRIGAEMHVRSLKKSSRSINLEDSVS